jgi:hypothetical protein
MISDETKAICQELSAAITARLDAVRRPIAVSPRVMRAMIIASQQQMTLSFPGGKLVTLIERDDAPPLEAAVEAACAPSATAGAGDAA